MEREEKRGLRWLASRSCVLKSVSRLTTIYLTKSVDGMKSQSIICSATDSRDYTRRQVAFLFSESCHSNNLSHASDWMWGGRDMGNRGSDGVEDHVYSTVWVAAQLRYGAKYCIHLGGFSSFYAAKKFYTSICYEVFTKSQSRYFSRFVF